MISLRQTLPGLMLAALAGCGGGGGGGTPPEQPGLTIPLATAIANYVNQTRSTPISVAGTITSGGQTVTVTGSGAASESTGPGSFEGQPALRKAKLGTVTTSYAVEPDGATSVVLKLIGRATDTAGTSVPLLSTFRVTTAGAITRLEDTTSVAVGGDSVTLTISYR